MKGGARPKLVATVGEGRGGEGRGEDGKGEDGKGGEGRRGEGKFGYMRSMEVRSVNILLPARTQMLCDEQSPFNGLSS